MAFPVNGVLDNFNRANATPMGGSWSGKIRSADVDLSINGNVAHANSAGNASAVWSPAVADDQEAYATVVTADVSDTSEVWVRLTSAGGAAPNGYRILFTDNGAGSDTLQLYRVNGGVFTQLGSTFTGTIASAQKIGIDAVGTTISAYSTTTGTWSTRVTATDSAWTTGSLAIITTANDSLDDFGGGAAVAAPVPVLLPTFNPIPLMQVGGP
jgi:hypothetical protein